MQNLAVTCSRRDSEINGCRRLLKAFQAQPFCANITPAILCVSSLSSDGTQLGLADTPNPDVYALPKLLPHSP